MDPLVQEQEIAQWAGLDLAQVHVRDGADDKVGVDEVLQVHGKSDTFYDGKRAAAAFLIAWEPPRTEPELVLLSSGDSLLRDLGPAVP